MDSYSVEKLNKPGLRDIYNVFRYLEKNKNKPKIEKGGRRTVQKDSINNNKPI